MADVHRELVGVSHLLAGLRQQAAALATDKDLRAVLAEEHTWLDEARDLVAEVRRFREWEDDRWSVRWRRYVLAMTCALATAAAVGAGYRILQDRDSDEALRARAAVGDAILERLDALTDTERRQVERLLHIARPRR